jgi:hypothetical protein
VSSVSGDFTIALNPDAEVVLVESTADCRLQAITGAEPGRVISLEHVRLSGVGNLTLQNQSGVAGTNLLVTDNRDVSLANRTCATLRMRPSFWRLESTSPGVMLTTYERSAGIPLAAGQGLFWAKDDAPNSPYFRDDTNADRKLLTAPLPLSDMATIAPGRVLGLQVDAGGAAVPVALTGAEQGENLRCSGQEDSPTAAGTYEPTLASTTSIYRVNPSADHIVAFTGFEFTGGNAGKFFFIVKQGADGHCEIRHNVGVNANNGLFTPDEQSVWLTAANACAVIWYQTSSPRWNVAALGTQITPWNLCRQRTPFGASNMYIAVTFTIVQNVAAGTPGAADDFTLFATNAPFTFSIVDVTFYCQTAIVGSTVQLRTATGGGGSSLSNAMSTTATGTVRSALGGIPGVIAGTSVYLRRSDAGVAGQLVLVCYRF